LSKEKKLSIAALSQTLPARLMEQTMPWSAISLLQGYRFLRGIEAERFSVLCNIDLCRRPSLLQRIISRHPVLRGVAEQLFDLIARTLARD